MIPLCNGFYLFPLSRAVNSNSLILDPSEFKIGLYNVFKNKYIYGAETHVCVCSIWSDWFVLLVLYFIFNG